MKRTSLTSAFAVTLGVVGLAAPVRADEEIKVGLMLPMKGVFAQLAQHIDRAWALALESRNYTVAGKNQSHQGRY